MSLGVVRLRLPRRCSMLLLVAILVAEEEEGTKAYDVFACHDGCCTCVTICRYEARARSRAGAPFVILGLFP